MSMIAEQNPQMKEAADAKLEQQARFWSAFFESIHRAEACAHGMQSTMERQSPEISAALAKIKEAKWWFRDAMGWGFERRAEDVLLCTAVPLGSGQKGGG